MSIGTDLYSLQRHSCGTRQKVGVTVYKYKINPFIYQFEFFRMTRVMYDDAMHGRAGSIVETNLFFRMFTLSISST